MEALRLMFVRSEKETVALAIEGPALVRNRKGSRNRKGVHFEWSSSRSPYNVCPPPALTLLPPQPSLHTKGNCNSPHTLAFSFGYPELLRRLPHRTASSPRVSLPRPLPASAPAQSPRLFPPHAQWHAARGPRASARHGPSPCTFSLSCSAL
jgi:hypothetical protein